MSSRSAKDNNRDLQVLIQKIKRIHFFKDLPIAYERIDVKSLIPAYLLLYAAPYHYDYFIFNCILEWSANLYTTEDVGIRFFKNM